MMNGTGENEEAEPFEIPTLPEGEELRFEFLSNWGDATSVGLHKIELFNAEGQRCEIAEVSTNVPCEECEVRQVFDQLAESQWKAEMESKPVITVKLAYKQAIAMLRVWNYNENRVHAQIGVRRLRVAFDETFIFDGEIECADDRQQMMADTILFTTNDSILESIAQNDVCMIGEFDEPTTPVVENFTRDVLTVAAAYRPVTCETNSQSCVSTPTTVIAAPAKPPRYKSPKNTTKVLHIEITSNWGAPGIVGLAGLEFSTPDGQVLSVDNIQISVANGGQGVERLLDGKNLSRNEEDMWLSPFDSAKPTTILVQFTEQVDLAVVSFWNYNVSTELSYAGAKTVNIYTNGALVAGNVLLRKAPGFVYFDFVQDVFIVDYSDPLANRPATLTICGFIFQLNLLSTWGDEYYVGLNGIEMFDRKNERIHLTPHNVAAFPESINILPSNEDDARTSEKLIDGVNDTDSAEHMWLTPMLPNRYARVFIIFDEPVFVSRMLIYNYRKTPERGVRHISVSVDDLIVFSGEMAASSPAKTAVIEVDMREP